MNVDRGRRFGCAGCRYALLTPDEMPRLLGCRIINVRALGDVLSLGRVQPGPRTFQLSIKTGGELILWLNGQLARTLDPGKPVWSA